MSKYNAKKTELDGYTFDSQIEARYFIQLKWLKTNKQIKGFEIQPKFLLQESFKKDGKTHRKIEYIADFKIINLDGSIEIIDIKGMTTPLFQLKQKLFHFRYPHKLKLLTYSVKWGGWIELDELSKLRKQAKKAKGKN